jgi:hypothetical protein
MTGIVAVGFKTPAMRYNHLLDYGSQEQLERLSDNERVALATAIARGERSRDAWQAVYELFALWPNGEAQQAALNETARLLATWDDTLRTIDSSSAALFAGGSLTPLARLAAGIDIYRREDRGGTELTAIASSTAARALRRLSIDRSDVAGRPWEMLVDSAVLGDLRHLHVTGSTVGFGGIPQLLGSTRLPALECLKLIDLGMTATSLEGVRHTVPFPHLRQIDFSRNVLRDAGAELLAQATWLEQIERLTLQRAFIADSGARALVLSRQARRLAHLDLTGNDVSGAERAALLDAARARGLRLII